MQRLPVAVVGVILRVALAAKQNGPNLPDPRTPAKPPSLSDPGGVRHRPESSTTANMGLAGPCGQPSPCRDVTSPRAAEPLRTAGTAKFHSVCFSVPVFSIFRGPTNKTIQHQIQYLEHKNVQLKNSHFLLEFNIC